MLRILIFGNLMSLRVARMISSLWWWSSIVSSPWGGIITTTLLFWLLSRITRSRSSPASAASLGSFLLLTSSMVASFRSNVPTLIPTYNTSNQSLITNSKFLA